MSLLLPRFMANLEQSRIRSPDAWSVKLIFSLTVTIYLTKSENRIKKSQNSSHSITLSKGPVFTKKC